MLDTLESQIKEVTSALKQESKVTRAQYLKSASDAANERNTRDDNNENKSKNTRSLNELDNPNNWSVLNAIMALNDEEKIKVFSHSLCTYSLIHSLTHSLIPLLIRLNNE